MDTIKYVERLKSMDKLIFIKSTGTPKMLAKKIGVKEWTLYKLIREMKILGAPIKYSKALKTYYYKTEGRLIVGFSNS